METPKPSLFLPSAEMTQVRHLQTGMEGTLLGWWLNPETGAKIGAVVQVLTTWNPRAVQPQYVEEKDDQS